MKSIRTRRSRYIAFADGGHCHLFQCSILQCKETEMDTKLVGLQRHDGTNERYLVTDGQGPVLSQRSAAQAKIFARLLYCTSTEI